MNEFYQEKTHVVACSLCHPALRLQFHPKEFEFVLVDLSFCYIKSVECAGSLPCRV